MKPINWINLFIMMNLIILFMNIIIYFKKSNKFFIDYKKKKINKMNWKW